MAESNLKLKLLIDTKAQRVLFGEADKNFIDFLFNLLSLPLGTVIKLLKKQTMVGSLGNVYASVQTMSDTYLQPNQNKNAILKPKVSICGSNMLFPNIIGSSSGGFVKGLVTYVVMDDLTVNPMSTISTLTLLNQFNVKKVDCLQEKVVTFNVNEGLNLLKASLQSNTALTDVFLGRVKKTTTPKSISRGKKENPNFK